VDSEQNQLVRASQGNAAAFRAIWGSHRDVVYKFAVWMTGDVANAEDITQASFLTLLEQPTRFQPSRGSLRTFLLAITRNQCRLQSRALWREVGLEEADEMSFQLAELLDRLTAEESMAIVNAAIANLPPLQREAIFLFEYEELTLDEAAAVANIDTGTFKSRFHRARLRLKRELEGVFKKGLSNGTRP